MMTNDKMEEFIKGEAIIEDVEPQVFVLLAKFAYKGLCGAGDGAQQSKKTQYAFRFSMPDLR